MESSSWKIEQLTVRIKVIERKGFTPWLLLHFFPEETVCVHSSLKTLPPLLFTLIVLPLEYILRLLWFLTTFQFFFSSRDEIGKGAKKRKRKYPIILTLFFSFSNRSQWKEFKHPWVTRVAREEEMQDNQRQEPLLNEDQNNYRVIKRVIPGKRTKDSNGNPFAQKLA